MKIFILCSLIILTLGTPLFAFGEFEWTGVDETIVEKFAEESGRPARDSFINTDKGDLLLFLFLLSGTIGGFISGYYFRQLFPTIKDNEDQDNVQSIS